MLWVLFWLCAVWWFVWTIIGVFTLGPEIIEKSRKIPKGDFRHVDVGFEYIQVLGISALVGWAMLPCYYLSNHFAKEPEVEHDAE
jgi:hypothetical protein